MATVEAASLSAIGQRPLGSGSGQVGRASSRLQGSYYPSPFFDIANTYLPSSIKSLFRFCAYYVATNPIVGNAIYRMAEFPITDIVIQETNEDLKAEWEHILEDVIDIKTTLVEIGLNYQAYGNVFLSLYLPFKRYLECQNGQCREKHPIDKIKYRYRRFSFMGKCPKCGHSGTFGVLDESIPQKSGIRIIFWDPHNIDIEYNPVTGKRVYKYIVPNNLRRVIISGKPRRVLNTIPTLFIDAVKKKQQVVFDSDQIFHMRRPTLAGKDMGWGHPVIMGVLKYLFVLQTFIKAREVVGQNYILPLWVLFPQSYNNENPFEILNMDRWQERVTQEILKWRQDCVTPETLVETYDGLRRADSIREGDLLKTHDGRWAAAEKLWRRPLRHGEKAYKVTVRGARAYTHVVSENHPYLAAKKLNNGNGHKLGEAQFIRVKNLEKGDYIGYPVRRRIVARERIDLADYVDRAVTDDWVYVDHARQNVPEAFELLHERGDVSFARGERQEVMFDRGWSVYDVKAAQNAIRERRTLRRIPRYLQFDEELAWVVGLYLAEGNLGHKQVMFARRVDEEESTQRLEQFFEKRFGAKCSRIPRSRNCIQLYVHSKVAKQLFEGLCPGVARTKKIPRIYMEAPDRIVVALLEGLWAGDGCWHEDGYSRKTQYCSASVDLAEGIRQLLLSLYVPATITYTRPSDGGVINGRRLRGNGAYRVWAHGEAKHRLRDLFERHKNPHKPHRIDAGVFRDGYFWHRIDRIDEVDAPEVIGIQMDKSEVAVQVEDDIETHGTFCIAASACGNSAYIPIMPLPLGFQHIGGQGTQLSVVPEIQNITADIIAGLMVPREFVFGGLSYSGTSITIRMLENQFLNFRNRGLRFVRWIKRKIGHAYHLKPVDLTFTDLRMADDVQRKQLAANLAAQKRMPWADVLEDWGKTPEDVKDQIDKEIKEDIERQVDMLKGQARAQGEAQLIAAKYAYKVQLYQQHLIAQAQQEAIEQGTMTPEQAQMAAQQAQANGGFNLPPDLMKQLYGQAEGEVAAGDRSMPEEALNFQVMDPEALIEGWAQQLAGIANEEERVNLIGQLSQGDAAQAAVAQRAIELLTQTDMRPLPKQRPPRRKTKTV